MKVRNGFVSNSSSSNFTVGIKDFTLEDFLQKAYNGFIYRNMDDLEKEIRQRYGLDESVSTDDYISLLTNYQQQYWNDLKEKLNDGFTVISFSIPWDDYGEGVSNIKDSGFVMIDYS